MIYQLKARQHRGDVALSAVRQLKINAGDTVKIIFEQYLTLYEWS